MPAKHKVGSPELHEIRRKVEQESEIIELAELHTTALKAHQHIHHRFTATGQLLPLLRSRPVDIQAPGFCWAGSCPQLWWRLLFCLDRIWG